MLLWLANLGFAGGNAAQGQSFSQGPGADQQRSAPVSVPTSGVTDLPKRSGTS